MTATKTYETHEINVCIDCLMLIANGGGEAVEPSWCPNNDSGRVGQPCDGTCEAAATAHADAVERNWPTSDGWQLHLGSGDCDIESCEGWFSWSACEGCGSRLGGTREHATAMRTTTEDQK